MTPGALPWSAKSGLEALQPRRRNSSGDSKGTARAPPQREPGEWVSSRARPVLFLLLDLSRNSEWQPPHTNIRKWISDPILVAVLSQRTGASLQGCQNKMSSGHLTTIVCLHENTDWINYLLQGFLHVTLVHLKKYSLSSYRFYYQQY